MNNNDNNYNLPIASLSSSSSTKSSSSATSSSSTSPSFMLNDNNQTNNIINRNNKPSSTTSSSSSSSRSYKSNSNQSWYTNYSTPLSTTSSVNSNTLLLNNNNIINNMDKIQLNQHNLHMSASPSSTLQSFQNASLLKSMAYLNPVLMMNLLASSSSPSKPIFSTYTNFSHNLISATPFLFSKNKKDSFMKSTSNVLFHNKNKTISNSDLNVNDIDEKDAENNDLSMTCENSNESECNDDECTHENYHENDINRDAKISQLRNTESFIRLMLNYSKNMNLNNNKFKNEGLRDVDHKNALKITNLDSFSSEDTFGLKKNNKNLLFSNKKKINFAVISTLID
jgi:hypothetical protein